MSAGELRGYLNSTYGQFSRPSMFVVDAATYGNVVQELIKEETNRIFNYVQLPLGPNDGIMFEEVELILMG